VFTVALIGPDGAGKTTISRRLEHALPRPVKYLYMGVNADSSNRMLPTTRLVRAIKRAFGARPDTAGPQDPNRAKDRPKNPLKRAAASVKRGLGLVNRLADEWFRQALAWYYKCTGNIVVFDRHYFSDYYHYDIAPGGQRRPLSRRIHGFMLQHVYPKPELVIYLDAPAEVLFARKSEGTLELLEQRRRDYLQMRELVPHFEVVDASRTEDEVTQDVTRLICDFYEAKTKHETTAQHVRS
jgi:thymidylate kinase